MERFATRRAGPALQQRTGREYSQMDKLSGGEDRHVGSQHRSRPRGTSHYNQEGVIMRKDGETNSFQPINERVLKESFLSHMSIGYHSQLIANYEARRKEEKGSFVDKFVFNL